MISLIITLQAAAAAHRKSHRVSALCFFEGNLTAASC
jgi:hypothetical protein